MYKLYQCWLCDADSVETESYVSEEAQYAYPAPAGYLDPNGVYYVNGKSAATSINFLQENWFLSQQGKVKF